MGGGYGNLILWIVFFLVMIFVVQYAVEWTRAILSDFGIDSHTISLFVLGIVGFFFFVFGMKLWDVLSHTR